MAEIDTVVVLRNDQIRKLAQAHEIGTDAKLAQTLRVSPQTLWRARRGEQVSSFFIARVMELFPASTFEQLFELVPPLAADRSEAAS